MTRRTNTAIDMSAVLTAAEVADLMRCAPATIRQLTRAGRFPAPIDDTLSPKLWRWSRRQLEQYIDGGRS